VTLREPFLFTHQESRSVVTIQITTIAADELYFGTTVATIRRSAFKFRSIRSQTRCS